MDVPQIKIALLSTSLGGIDEPPVHAEQSMPYDSFYFTDKDLPPRVMGSRLQAKIPKMFGWQLKSDYDFYLWLDGNMRLNKLDTLRYFFEEIQKHDIVVLRHHRRPNIRQEVRYLRKGMREESKYLVNRYKGELWQEQYKEIQKDKDFTDDLLVIGGIFMYRNTPKVQEMFKEWWYQITRYCVQDQTSFPYVLKKSGIKIKVLDHDYTKWDYIAYDKHTTR